MQAGGSQVLDLEEAGIDLAECSLRGNSESRESTLEAHEVSLG
jgi:hypothetical protein